MPSQLYMLKVLWLSKGYNVVQDGPPNEQTKRIPQIFGPMTDEEIHKKIEQTREKARYGSRFKIVEIYTVNKHVEMFIDSDGKIGELNEQ